VPQHGGKADALTTVDGVKVTAAYAARLYPDANLSLTGIRQIYLFNAQWIVLVLHDGSPRFHPSTLLIIESIPTLPYLHDGDVREI
jgi:hypothetical protein